MGRLQSGHMTLRSITSATLLRFALASLASLASTACPASAQRPSPALDSIVRHVMAEQHVVGASVLVSRDGRVLLHQGYGLAELGLGVPSTPETAYHIVGPMLPFTGVAVMQLVERGKLSLTDDISTYIPEFPMQGRRVSIRQLLDHTSGIVDYHYLGDPIEATSRQPKALDEVMALYAGRSWVNEPGSKWDWSISGFQLLVTIVERVSGQRFADYVQHQIFAPAGLANTSYCDDWSVVRGLSHAYRRFENGFVMAKENDMAYNADLRFCSTVGDLSKLWSALRAGKLLRAETFRQMATSTGAASQMNAQDPKAQYGLALSINHEDDHLRWGQHGSLFGYSGSLYEFPNDKLTIVVLSNTEGQNAYAITRALARAVLGLPALPPRCSARCGSRAGRCGAVRGGTRPARRDVCAQARPSDAATPRFVRAVRAHVPRVRREWTADDPGVGRGAATVDEAGRRIVRHAVGAGKPNDVRDGGGQSDGAQHGVAGAAVVGRPCRRRRCPDLPGDAVRSRSRMIADVTSPSLAAVRVA